MKPLGTVSIVGAGPGDPELLTLKAVRAITSADVIVHDRLVSPDVLALAPQRSVRIDVGKQPRQHPVPQSEINDLLVRLARQGNKVVRLKGGDPFIFGRGSEEALELQRHGIPFAIIPGITSAQGAAASLRIPLTHRGIATSVRYVTGHCRDDKELELDWDGLADADTTVVIYMGLANIEQISRKLQMAGRRADTPVAAVNNATLAAEERLYSTLGRLVEDLRSVSFAGPVLFIVGEVVSIHQVLSKMDVIAHESSVDCASG
jgi:uroporphyrin-III C-methyltransferase